MKEDRFHVCYVCNHCAMYEKCLRTETIRMCRNSHSVEVNRGLDDRFMCDAPVTCGIELCNIKCFKGEDEIYE